MIVARTYWPRRPRHPENVFACGRNVLYEYTHHTQTREKRNNKTTVPPYFIGGFDSNWHTYTAVICMYANERYTGTIFGPFVKWIVCTIYASDVFVTSFQRLFT